MKTKLICETGSNWRTLDDWKRYIDQNRKIGALTKGQLWRTDKFINKKRNPKMYEACKRFEVPREWVMKLRDPDVFWTAFDKDSLLFLKQEINPVYYKVAALDSDQEWMIDSIARTNRQSFISCGVYGLDSIRQVVKWYRNAGNLSNLTLMHAIVDYKREDYQLGYFHDRLLGTRIISWGISMNKPSKVIPSVAVGMGAQVVEIHTKLPYISNTPDAPHSMNYRDLAETVRNIEEVEGNMSNLERPLPCELPHIKVGKRKGDGKR